MPITFKLNKEFNRYESNITTDNGYFAKFIIHKLSIEAGKENLKMRKEHKLYRLKQLFTITLNQKAQIDPGYIWDLKRRIKNII